MALVLSLTSTCSSRGTVSASSPHILTCTLYFLTCAGSGVVDRYTGCTSTSLPPPPSAAAAAL